MYCAKSLATQMLLEMRSFTYDRHSHCSFVRQANTMHAFIKFPSLMLVLLIVNIQLHLLSQHIIRAGWYYAISRHVFEHSVASTIASYHSRRMVPRNISSCVNHLLLDSKPDSECISVVSESCIVICL